MERYYLEMVWGIGPSLIQIDAAASPSEGRLWRKEAPWIVFFTEPYETDLWHAEAMYREVLPRLCQAARASQDRRAQAASFRNSATPSEAVKATLSESDQKLVTVLETPLSTEIFRNTSCAATVESTLAFERAAAGIPAFLCGWMWHMYSGYALQYAGYGVGNLVNSPHGLLDIPKKIATAAPGPDLAQQLVQAGCPAVTGRGFVRHTLSRLR